MQSRNSKRVLNAGCGAAGSDRLHVGFRGEGWSEVRLDIDPRTAPDFVGSISDMRGIVPDASFDAVFSSHSIEHLHAHEVAPAFREFRRVLKPGGFALITCPDLGAIARLLARQDLESVVYVSPAGPVKVLDMLYGHGPSIAEGRVLMAHNTGFTDERLGRVAIESGFAEARVMAGETFDLWAVLLTPNAAVADISPLFEGTNVAPLFSSPAASENRESGPLVKSNAAARAGRPVFANS